VREKTCIAMARRSDAHRDTRRGNRGGRAPWCFAQHRDVVAAAADLEQTAHEWTHWRPPVLRMHGPERIRGDDVIDARHESSDVGGVSLAPDVDDRVGISALQRRRERGREHEISEIVERNEQDATWILSSGCFCARFVRSG